MADITSPNQDSRSKAASDSDDSANRSEPHAGDASANVPVSDLFDLFLPAVSDFVRSL